MIRFVEACLLAAALVACRPEASDDCPTRYFDEDDDGYGDPLVSRASCQLPSGWVDDASDCDDLAAWIHPGASEGCDDADADEDCDGASDDLDPEGPDSGVTTFFVDLDHDGWGDLDGPIERCDLPDGYTAVSGDCDDLDPEASPDSLERCGGADENCDGEIDESAAIDAATRYFDGDEDGHGDPLVSLTSCTAFPVWVESNDDCDDLDAAAHPGAQEVCDGDDVDEDCNGAADDQDTALAATDKPFWFVDDDHDDFGWNDDAIASCEPVGARITVGGDCADDDGLRNPAVLEDCDNVDDDCDGVPDDGVPRCADGLTLPPDPATVAPKLDRGTVTSVASATAFLYTGSDPIQVGVAEGTIDPAAAAVLRGTLFDRNGSPVPGARVSIVGHEEYGSTLTRLDGEWDLVVNGGDVVVVDFTKDGWLRTQRTAHPTRQSWDPLDDVVLVQQRSVAGIVDLTGASGIQTVSGPMENDADGTRGAVLVFPAGVTADAWFTDGSSTPLDQGTLRVTEYTLGSTGEKAMPGTLPPSSAYTYAVEFSFDEAQDAGASTVVFSDTIVAYVDNFLDFPVGISVPSGAYDREGGVWVPGDDGLVLEVLWVGTGYAEIDVDGSGVPASAATLADLGITDLELAEIASTFEGGDVLWRVPMTHFTPWDYNWPYVLPSNSKDPDVDVNEAFDDPAPECKPGSVIECENQILHESVAITGAPFALHYSSSDHNRRSVTFKVSGATVPSSLQSIEIEIEILGRHFIDTRPPQANQSFTFEWDGLDAYGRPAQGAQTAVIRIGYTYRPVYAPTVAAFRQSWGKVGKSVVGTAMGQSRSLGIVRWGTYTRSLGGWDPAGEALGGWSVSAVDHYSPGEHKLYRGNGTRATVPVQFEVTTVAGVGNPNCVGVVPIIDGTDARTAPLCVSGIAASNDGTVYVSDWARNRVFRVNPDGRIYLHAGNGSTGNTLDGGPATLAALDIISLTSEITTLALDKEGRLYIPSACVVRRVDTDGTIQTIAGTINACGTTGKPGTTGDGGLATSSLLRYPIDVAIADDGALYILESGLPHQWYGTIRKVDTNGIINTVAGNPSGGGFGSCGIAYNGLQLADSLYICWARAIDIGPAGDIYVSDSSAGRIQRIAPDGRVYTVAGAASSGEGSGAGLLNDGDYAPSRRLTSPMGMAVDRRGDVYFVEQGMRMLGWRLSPGLVATSVFGSGVSVGPDFVGEGGPALDAKTCCSLGSLAVVDGGVIYLATGGRVLRLAPPFPNFDGNAYTLADPSGASVLSFDADGRHQSTHDAFTGTTLLSFTYDVNAYLASVIDADGLATLVERDSSGNPTAFVSPYGERTKLTLDADDRLAAVEDPAGNTWRFTYDAQGLLASFTDPDGNTSAFTYDDQGKLLTDTDAMGGVRELTRGGSDAAFSVAFSSPEGRTTTLAVSSRPSGDMTKVRIDPAGLVTTTSVGGDGSMVVDSPDGTRRTTLLSPDPRFGMQAPYVSETVTSTPSGLTHVVTHKVTATLSEPDDPTSLLAWSAADTVQGDLRTTMYDPVARRYTRTSPEGRAVTIGVDPVGRLTTISPDGFEDTTWSRDAFGRVETMVMGARVYSFGYNSTGRVSTGTDPLGQVASLAYDASGRLTSSTREDGTSIAFGHDGKGLLTSLTLPTGSVHSFEYDAQGQVTRYTPPSAGVSAPWTDYAWDLDGNLTSKTLPSGEVVTFERDLAGRPMSVTHDGGTISYSYDATGGQVVSVAAPDADVAFTRDGFLPVTQAWSGGVAGSVELAWGDDLRLASVTVDETFPVFYAYDSDGLVVQAGDLILDRNAATGAVSATTLGLLSTSDELSTYGELQSRDAQVSGAALLQTEYVRDNLGRIVSRDESIDGGITWQSWSYGYDAIGRLTTAALDGEPYATYGYDGNGNRTRVADAFGDVVATFDAQDRLVAQGDVTLAWTNDGDLAVRTATVGTTTYDYDALGNLREVALANGITISYVVDGLNRRIARYVDGALAAGYLWQAPLQIAAELDETGAVRARFVYADSGNVPAYMVLGGATYRFITEPNGSVRLVVDVGTGEVVQRIDYDPFGRVLADTNAGFQPFGFAGGMYDPATGLVRLGARDYDPGLGRWTTKDPIGFAGGAIVLYTYAHNDPVNIEDPSGLWGWGGGVSGSAEVGIGPVGIGANGGVGVMHFPNTGEVGFIGYGGSILSGPNGSANFHSDSLDSNSGVAGANVSIAPTFIGTNASQLTDLCGPFDTFSITLGLVLGIDLQFGIDWNTGVFIISVSPGSTDGIAISRYPTTTDVSTVWP